MKLEKWDALDLLPPRIGPIPASFPLSVFLSLSLSLTLFLSLCLLLCLILSPSLSLSLVSLPLPFPPTVGHRPRILLRRCTSTASYSSYRTGEVRGYDQLAWKCLWWRVKWVSSALILQGKRKPSVILFALTQTKDSLHVVHPRSTRILQVDLSLRS